MNFYLTANPDLIPGLGAIGILSGNRFITCHNQNSSVPEYDTHLLLHFEGDAASGSFVDSSPNNHTVTNGSTTTIIDNENGKFGGCVTFRYDNNAGIGVSTLGDLMENGFTIEFFFRIDSSYSGDIIFMGNDWWVLDHNAFGDLDGTIALFLNENAIPRDDAWHHFAWGVSDTGVTSMWVDGNNALPEVTESAFIGSDLFGSNFAIGKVSWASGSKYLDLDEFRITSGVRYNSSFTPPNQPFSVA